MDYDLSPDTVTCDVGGLDADLVTVEAIARLQLAAQRSGCQVRLERASPELELLLELCGLADLD